MSVMNDVDLGRIALLESIQHQGKEWDVLAPRYGVTNPDPPWKTSLIGMCECLAVGGSLPTLDRRRAEDELEIPFIVRFRLLNVSCSHSSMSCSSAG